MKDPHWTRVWLAMAVAFAVSAVVLEALSFSVAYVVIGRVAGMGGSLFERAGTIYSTVGFGWHAQRQNKAAVPLSMAPDKLLGYRLRPNTDYPTPDLQGGQIWPLTSNRYGFIANVGAADRETTPDARTLNIFITGGSTVQGIGASANSATIASRLEANLNALKDPRATETRAIRAINAGVGGYNATQEMVYLATELRFLHPTVVVMLNGINESSEDALVGREYHLIPGTKPHPLDALPVPLMPATQSVISALFRKLGLIDRDDTAASGLPPVLRPRSERYAAIVATAAGIANDAGAAFVYVLQPTTGIGARSPSTAEQRRSAAMGLNDPQRWSQYADRMNEFYAEMRHRIAELEKRHPGSAFVDGSLILDREAGDVYWDPRHYTDLGQQAIANFLTEQLRARYWERLGLVRD